MTLQEIKNAVDEGREVRCGSEGSYRVIKDHLGQYFIEFPPNGHLIGLTWEDGVTINGLEEFFYIDKSKEKYED